MYQLPFFTSQLVMKKMIFYKMKIRAIQRQCIEMKGLLKEQLENLQDGPVSSLLKLANASKEVCIFMQRLQFFIKDLEFILEQNSKLCRYF